ncbi:MAG TPA: hypothetical protein VK431_03990 [Nitrosopumilaceae archaeon]|nr:hypothetical protein [Nitrosopumilaceae archaeon]
MKRSGQHDSYTIQSKEKKIRAEQDSENLKKCYVDQLPPELKEHILELGQNFTAVGLVDKKRYQDFAQNAEALLAKKRKLIENIDKSYRGKLWDEESNLTFDSMLKFRNYIKNNLNFGFAEDCFERKNYNSCIGLASTIKDFDKHKKHTRTTKLPLDA